MIRGLIAIMLVLPSLAIGQYTYFNIGLLPPHPEVGNAFCTNIFLRHDTLVTFHVSANATGIERNHYSINSNGQIVDELTFGYPNHSVVFGEYSDAVNKIDGGHLFGTGFYSPGYAKMHGRITKYDESFNEQWFYTRDEFQADSLDFSEYEYALELQDHNLMGCGVSHIDSMFIQDFGTVIDTVYWSTHSNLFITKLNPNGELIWHKDFYYHNYPGFHPPAIFARLSQIIELSNGNLLLWGGWYDPFDPFVIKLDPEGNFLDELHWGNSTLSDWLAWPVQISNFEFMFAYSHAFGTSSLGQVLSNIQLGILNSSTMAISSVHTYDHVYSWGGVVDFEATPDGGFVVLGYGGDPTIPNFMGEAYMMKIDANFNEEWFHAYHPPIPWYSSPNVYDLEIMPDGGMVFCGDFYVDSEPMGYTWFVKTDACGELANNGCAVGLDETQNASQEMVIYPNPAQDVLNINATRDFVFVKVYNTLGQEVMTTSSPSPVSIQTLNISSLPAGMYEIRLLDENKVVVHTAPLIKN